MSEFDAAVVGAGVAGLAAAVELAKNGNRVLCIEARDRIGGRICTVHDTMARAPVELGAEFVHGRAPEVFAIARAANLTLYDGSEKALRVRDGAVAEGRGDAWEQVGRVMRDLEQAAKERDETFAEFLAKTTYPADVKELATRYTEGFNAAHRDVVGIRSLAKDAEAADAIDGDRAFRVVDGYEAVPLALWRSVARECVCLRLSRVLHEVRWRAGSVELRCGHALTSEPETFTVPKAVFTVPLGVMQGDSIQWLPSVPRKNEAARALRFGQVVRVTLRFREAFWEEREEFADIGFLLSNEELFPTWWTTLAARKPLLTGWSAGPRVEPLLGKTRLHVVKSAVSSLAKVLGVQSLKITNQLERAYFHDWHTDPFAQGAYSYVPAYAMGAREELSRSVDGTLYFAGEATELNGHSATVHGAIASGVRAAREMSE